MTSGKVLNCLGDKSSFEFQRFVTSLMYHSSATSGAPAAGLRTGGRAVGAMAVCPVLGRWGGGGPATASPRRWFIFLWFSKITADGDCSHEIERHLLLGRKVMTKLDSILKSRDITLLRSEVNLHALNQFQQYSVLSFSLLWWEDLGEWHWNM